MLTKEQNAFLCKELSMALAFICIMIFHLLLGGKWTVAIWMLSVIGTSALILSGFTEDQFENSFFFRMLRYAFFIGLGPITILTILFQSLLWKPMVENQKYETQSK